MDFFAYALYLKELTIVSGKLLNELSMVSQILFTIKFNLFKYRECNTVLVSNKSTLHFFGFRTKAWSAEKLGKAQKSEFIF